MNSRGDLVRDVAAKLKLSLEPHAERVEIAGSVRRGKDQPKDVDLVILNPKESYAGYTDGLINAGNGVKKATYGEKKPVTRWGEKLRALEWNGITIELNVVDDFNFGYLFWLRTGPGDAGKWFMGRIKDPKDAAPFQCRNGYVWHEQVKLHIPDEKAWFALLGIPFIEPAQRMESVYQHSLDARDHRWGDPRDFYPQGHIALPPGVSLTLSDETDEERAARIEAEREYNRHFEAWYRQYRDLKFDHVAMYQYSREQAMLDEQVGRSISAHCWREKAKDHLYKAVCSGVKGDAERLIEVLRAER